MRDPDGWTYFKEETGGLVVGGFEPEAKPWRSPDDLPYPFEFQLLPEDWEHFSVLMDEALLRIPALEETGIRKFYNGPESFTPDNQFLLGEAPGLRGFFVGAGFNSVGIASAGGAGRALAEWIVAGEPQDDLVAVDVRRFAPLHADNGWLRSRVAEVLGLHYAVPGPTGSSSRPARSAPRRCTAGWPPLERSSGPGWAGSDRTSSDPPTPLSTTPGASRRGWRGRRPSSVPAAATSRSSTRPPSRSTSSPARTRSSGCSGSAPPTSTCRSGSCVYTPFLSARGTYEADLTVTRTGSESFLLVSSSATTVRDLDWLARHGVPARDVTDVVRRPRRHGAAVTSVAGVAV